MCGGLIKTIFFDTPSFGCREKSNASVSHLTALEEAMPTLGFGADHNVAGAGVDIDQFDPCRSTPRSDKRMASTVQPLVEETKGMLF